MNFLRDTFSIKFYTISSLRSFHDIFYHFFIDENHYAILDTEVKVFHESISYFMKWPWNCISLNALKEKFHSLSFPLKLIKNSLPNKSRIPESLKNNRSSSKAFQLMYPYLTRICWGRSTGCFIYNFVIQVISEKTLCSKGFTSNLWDIFTWK